MSDFIMRLAQRCAGEPPAIRPRLPHLFAPLMEPLRKPGEPLGGPSIVEADNAPLVAEMVQRRPPPAPLLRFRNALPSDPVTQESSPVSAKPQGNPRPGQTPGPKRVASTAQSTSARPRAKPATPQDPIAQVSPSVIQNAPSAVLSFQASPQPLNQNPSDAPGDPRSTLLPRRTAPRPPARLSMADKAARTDEGVSVEPAVHISIGRVDVRTAIAAPPPPPRPNKRSKPALSLDDYLKYGGGRT